MRQAATAITLGVRDLARARRFYEALGWTTGAAPQDDVSRAEVDAATEEARAAGAPIGREPAPTFWGGYSSVFIDPDGHPWEIAHNPHWTLTPGGGVRLP